MLPRPIHQAATLLLGIFLASSVCQAAPRPWTALEAKRKDINETFLWVDLGWAVSNIASGLILKPNASPKMSWFYNANILFNSVSLGFIGAGYLLESLEDGGNSPSEVLARINNDQRVLSFLIGLDVAFFTTGFIINHLSDQADTPVRRNTLAGSGISFMVQGGFFAVLHTITLLSLNHISDQSLKFLKHVKFAGNSVTLHWEI